MQKAEYPIGIVLAKIPGYSETFLHNKINGLIEKGYSAKVFVNIREKTGYPKKWKVYHQPKAGRFAVITIPAMLITILAAFLRKPNHVMRFCALEKKDGISLKKRLISLYLNTHILVHRLEWLHFGFSTMAVGKENVAKAMGARMAVSLRGYDISIYPLKHAGCYNRLWQKVDKVHTLSRALIQLAWNHGLPMNTRWKRIPPAIRADKFQPNGRAFSFPGSPVKILTVSRLHWIKGLDYALQALKILKDQHYPFHYTIIGTGEEWERLHYTRHQLNLENEVEFTGKISHMDIPGYMHSHNIYLQPSLQEGFCNSVLEAQAAGMLCIVTDAEGLTENVIEDQTGWIVPRRNPRAIAEKIVKITEASGERLAGIRSAATKRVAAEFQVETQIEKFVEFYEPKS